MIRVREGVDVLELLKACGFSTYTLRKLKIMGEYRIQKLRNGEPPTIPELDFICAVTVLPVEQIIEYVPSEINIGSYHRS